MYICPKCGSTEVHEIDNAWRCDVCGYTTKDPAELALGCPRCTRALEYASDKRFNCRTCGIWWESPQAIHEDTWRFTLSAFFTLGTRTTIGDNRHRVFDTLAMAVESGLFEFLASDYRTLLAEADEITHPERDFPLRMAVMATLDSLNTGKFHAPCPVCGWSLHVKPFTKCPECGWEHDMSDDPRQWWHG